MIYIFWKKYQVISNFVSMQGLEVGNLACNTRIAATYKSVTYLLNSYIVQFLRHKSCDNLIYRAWAITNTVANCLLILSMGCLKDYHCSTDKGAAVCAGHQTTPPALQRKRITQTILRYTARG